jgi:hypothetical protein
MNATREHLFVELDALTVEQIEAGLAAGVWGDNSQSDIEHYVLRRKLEAEQVNTVFVAQQTAKLALEEAASTKLRATAALIVATGAMLAAMASAFIAFLAMGGFRINPFW